MLKLELFLLDLAIVITTLEARRPTKQRDVKLRFQNQIRVCVYLYVIDCGFRYQQRLASMAEGISNVGNIRRL